MNSLMIIFFSEIPENASEFLRLQTDYAKFNSRVWCVKTKLDTKKFRDCLLEYTYADKIPVFVINVTDDPWASSYVNPALMEWARKI